MNEKELNEAIQTIREAVDEIEQLINKLPAPLTLDPIKVSYAKETGQPEVPKDNTQRIRDVRELVPEEMKKWIKQVYIMDNRVCVKANFLKLPDYTILAKFMDESLGAKRITDGKESRWELP